MQPKKCPVVWIYLLMCLTYVSSSSDLGSSLPSSTATEYVSESSSLFSFGGNRVNLPSTKKEKLSFSCIVENYKCMCKGIANK